MHAMVESILDELRGAWRFRWIALIVAWAICLVGWAGILTMRDTYEASARVFVDTSTTLSKVTEGLTVESDIATQITRVRQALLGGPQLEKVAREAGLQLASGSPQERQALLSKVRDSILISDSDESSNDKSSAGLYVISYQDTDRERGLRVVDRLLNSFVESSLGGKRAGSETAQRFLIDQIADYERRLSEAEARLADFKRNNVGLMPGAQGDYFSRLQAEMDGVTKAQEMMNIATRRRGELDKQLRGGQPFVSGGAQSQSSGNTAAGGGDTGVRIRETQAKLDDLLLRFTDKHPDVIALRGTLDELQAQQQRQVEAVRRGDPGAVAGLGLSANPVYQSIQLEMNRADVEIAALRGEIDSRQRKISDLRRLVDTAPEVEAEFARLNRDYNVTRAQYEQLVAQLEKARLSEQAEATGVVSFEVIDPPSSPFSPVAPNRVRLILMVLLGGLIVGAGLAYLLHQLKPVITTSRQLNEITGLPVLGVVSMTWLERYQARARRDFLVYVGALGSLVVCAGLVLAGQSFAIRMLQRLMS